MNSNKLKLLNLAEKYFNANNYVLAENLLIDFLKKNPSNSRANELLGYIYGNDGRLDLCFRFLETACQQENCTADALYYLGSVELKKGFYERAVVHFKKSISKAGNFFEGLYDLGDSYFFLGNISDALSSYQKCLSFNNNSPELFFNIARCFDELKKYDEAISFYDKAILLQSKFDVAWLNKAIVLSELNRYEESISCCDKAINLKLNSDEAFLIKGLALTKLNRYEEALACYNQLIQLNPDHLNAWINKGDILNKLNRYDESVISCDKAIHLKSDSIEPWFNKGIAFTGMNHYQEALDSYIHVIKLNSNYINAWINKGDILKKLNHYSESIISCDKAINLDQKNEKLWTNKGAVLNEINRYDDAIKCFDIAIEISSDYPEAWFNKGVSSYLLKKYDDAITCFDKAIQLKPDYESAWQHRSLLNLHLKNFKQGWKDHLERLKFKDALSIYINDLPLWDGNESCKNLLILCMQGIGDEIFYSSILNQLTKRIKNFSVLCDKRLIPIFSRSFPFGIFLDRENPVNLNLFDAQISIESLFSIINLDHVGEMTKRSSYLLDDKNLSNKYRCQPLFKDNFTCGIAWKSFNNKIGKDKSINLIDLKEILLLPNCEFINLQYGDVSEEIESVKQTLGVNLTTIQGVDIYSDINQLISIIKACDVVITTSNVTAHLAGSVGKKTLMLLPYSKGRIWYWHEEKTSTWYSSIEQFSQDSRNTWSIAEQEIKFKINQLINEKFEVQISSGTLAKK